MRFLWIVFLAFKVLFCFIYGIINSVQHNLSNGNIFTRSHEISHIFKAGNLLRPTQEPAIGTQSEADEFRPKSFCFLNVSLICCISNDA